MTFRNVQALEMCFSLVPATDGRLRETMVIRYADGIMERFVRASTERDWSRV
ncbi:hypothetical protein [Sabulicella glaciei]|uniref:Uncharacterized protein n=1 Tax=Sabulicella glaciei TaxID=2984948 RepID=A0ABT3P066_9PROT|nr:hypothetical protein [Roseococcus sp. MDT2-1-1]MCW8087806.1 hypothetical protein [Roseococcus sp. MDT2-1-1]